jgi:transcription elongation factor Elf1
MFRKKRDHDPAYIVILEWLSDKPHCPRCGRVARHARTLYADPIDDIIEVECKKCGMQTTVIPPPQLLHKQLPKVGVASHAGENKEGLEDF